MSKPDEYRANAQECQRMAGISRNPNEKAIWQQMAQRWLGMIPEAGACKSDQFEAAYGRVLLMARNPSNRPVMEPGGTSAARAN